MKKFFKITFYIMFFPFILIYFYFKFLFKFAAKIAPTVSKAIKNITNHYKEKFESEMPQDDSDEYNDLGELVDLDNSDSAESLINSAETATSYISVESYNSIKSVNSDGSVKLAESYSSIKLVETHTPDEAPHIDSPDEPVTLYDPVETFCTVKPSALEASVEMPAPCSSTESQNFDYPVVIDDFADSNELFESPLTIVVDSPEHEPFDYENYAEIRQEELDRLLDTAKRHENGETPHDYYIAADAYMRLGAEYRKRAIDNYAKFLANPLYLPYHEMDKKRFIYRTIQSLADLYEKDHQFPKAVQAYEKLSDFYPNEVPGYIGVARCLRKSNDIDGAIQFLEQLKTADSYINSDDHPSFRNSIDEELTDLIKRKKKESKKKLK